MSHYLYGCDVLGADDGDFASAISALIRAQSPLSTERAHYFIARAVDALAEMNFYDQEENTSAWRDDMAAQLARMDETIVASHASTLPDKATGVLCRAIADVAAMIDDGAQIYPHLALTEDRLLQEMGAKIQVLGAEENDAAGGDEVDVVLGELADVLGMFDFNVERPKMDKLKPVTNGIAKSLVQHGLQVMSIAESTAKQHSLPGETDRLLAIGHLQWHVASIGKSPGGPNGLYGSADDLKKWVLQAFVEGNAVEEGAAYLEEAWSQMWAEIEKQLAELPKNIVQTIAKLPGKAFEAVTGIPSWAFYLGTAALVAGVGYVGYKIATGPVGGAVAGHYLRRFG